MTATTNNIYRKITNLQTGLIELRAMLANIDLPDTPKPKLPHCPQCGPIHLPQGTTLADHQHTTHNNDQETPQ